MKWNHPLRIMIVSILIAAASILFRSAVKSYDTIKTNKSNKICSKCNKQQSTPSQDLMIWESLSRQFFS
ncbi:MAG: hypothetical protein JST17_07840 [Bacteroidetes bacterium]|nr:hypothetical protein [Bacteroidota bacterium]MBS1931568.1 hypothetical protein [Bacteroidota bacterium]